LEKAATKKNRETGDVHRENGENVVFFEKNMNFHRFSPGRMRSSLGTIGKTWGFSFGRWD
jgi:hypothetical protein